jgi:hypothetical protein
MRLGVSYNIFDGEELLEGSIKQIRSHVDYVSVVFQTISNFGNQSNPELIPLLERLKSEGLIDELYHYNPKIDAGGHHNEMKKRTISDAKEPSAAIILATKMLLNVRFKNNPTAKGAANPNEYTNPAMNVPKGPQDCTIETKGSG